VLFATPCFLWPLAELVLRRRGLSVGAARIQYQLREQEIGDWAAQGKCRPLAGLSPEVPSGCDVMVTFVDVVSIDPQ
jgi:hypothetical protein